MKGGFLLYNTNMMDKKKIIHLNIEYSLVSALFWITYCPVTAFTSVFLLDKGLSNTIIGFLIAGANILAALAQPALGSIVDRNKKMTAGKMTVILAACTDAASLFLCCLTRVSFLFFIFMILSYTSIICIQPFMNSLAFDYEKNGYKINFGIGRGIGSVSYAITSMVLGWLVKKYSPSLLPLTVLIMSSLMIVSVLIFSNKGMEKKESDDWINADSLLQFIAGHKKFIILQVGVILIFFCHSLINVYLLQIEQSVGGNASDMGTAFSVAALTEVPVMFLFVKLKARIRCERLLMISCILFSLKHFLMIISGSIIMILCVQAMECVTFAIYTPASVYYTQELIETRNISKGQAINIFAKTSGAILAAFFGGILIDTVGIRKMLIIGFIFSLIGSVIVACSIESIKKEAEARM